MATFFRDTIQGNALLESAYELGRKTHHGVMRKNGENYFDHCIAVGKKVLEWGLDAPTLAAAFLHDAPKAGVPLKAIEIQINEEVAFLVDRAHRVSQIRYNGLQTNVENIRKLVLFLAEDVRVIILRLASRLHNMGSLYVFPQVEQKRIALETMDVYAPLAYQLGMHQVSAELEDLAFPYIYPKEYSWLVEAVKERRENRARIIAALAPRLKETLHEYEVPVLGIEARVKHYTSLYRKLLRYEMDLEKIYDLVALRLITKDIRDCYAALGVIHKLWTPVPGRVKDYIAVPKENGYRSLHTAVVTPDNRVVEIQVRTVAMHEEAEYGIAAHIRYALTKGTSLYTKRRSVAARSTDLAVLEQFRGWQAHFGGKGEMPASVKIDLFRDHILVLTPKADVIELPKGATPVDFSYKIHSEVGNHAVAAKVNGSFVPLNHVLESGDVVEVLTQKNKKPSASWLEFTKTHHARHHVKAALKGVAGFFETAPKPKRMRITLVSEEKLGILKAVTEVFDEAHIKLQSIVAKPESWITRTPQIALECRLLSPKEKEIVIKKLKNLSGMKKVSARTVT